MKLHPQILSKEGRKQFVILPYEEYQAIQERLADSEDLAALRKAIREDNPTQKGLSLQGLRKELGISTRPTRKRRTRRPPA
jgi:hypothetical protein